MANYNSKLQSNNTDLQGILNTINALPDAGGVELPELTDPAMAGEIFLGKEVIDEQGNVKTGTFTIENELSNQSDLIAQLQTMVDELPEVGEQIAPEISINASNGLITATAGNTTSTYQMAFQGAKTITPSTVTQIAISSGHYAGGSVTVAGDSNLVASNIKSGVSIFGVNGTLQEGSGSGANEEEIIAEFLETEPTVIENGIATKIRKYAFYNCSSLTSVNFPVATTIDNNAFANCSSLTSVNFPACITVGSDAFAHCSMLTSVNFPATTTINKNAFYTCSRLASINFPAVTTIGSYAFTYCYMLTSANFPVTTTIGSNAFFRCSMLASINFPAVTAIGSSAFCNCYMLTSVNFPVATTISSDVFYRCSMLASANFPAVTAIYTSVFYACGNLSHLELGANISSVCTLTNSNAFTSTPFAGYSASFSGTPHIYVPASLVSAYQSATNWTYFSSYFSSIESLENN